MTDHFDEADLHHDPAMMTEEELIAYEEYLAETESLAFDRDEYFTSAEAQAKVGQHIRTTVAFSGVPKGTTGVVCEPTDRLVSLPIQWDLPGRTRPLVDWFTKWEYERYLEEIADD